MKTKTPLEVMKKNRDELDKKIREEERRQKSDEDRAQLEKEWRDTLDRGAGGTASCEITVGVLYYLLDSGETSMTYSDIFNLNDLKAKDFKSFIDNSVELENFCKNWRIKKTSIVKTIYRKVISELEKRNRKNQESAERQDAYNKQLKAQTTKSRDSFTVEVDA